MIDLQLRDKESRSCDMRVRGINFSQHWIVVAAFSVSLGLELTAAIISIAAK